MGDDRPQEHIQIAKLTLENVEEILHFEQFLEVVPACTVEHPFGLMHIWVELVENHEQIHDTFLRIEL